MQGIYDKLYKESKEGKTFNNLYRVIYSRNNILMAYRNIKRNNGSITPGVDNKNILDIKKMDENELVTEIQKRLENYIPKPVRRVLIPKSNGKRRPLGIPTIMDRIVQQCIKQVLEPICEAKFHPHSYGFRPYRRAEHAIARMSFLINNSKLMYVVDIDIKGFFDNVNHAKLSKQLWSLGIRDKKLLCIINKMLKAPIEGIGATNKGTPQGGILSPLLANVVLNELDWWVSSQWENIKTKHQYTQTGGKYRELKTRTKLKEGFIVRYADDFKIMCRDYESARKWFIAIRMWLKERLKLDISEDKSRITNLYKEKSKFLGLNIFTIRRKNKSVAIHCIDKDRLEKMYSELKVNIIKIHRYHKCEDISRLNSIIMGYHNYFSIGAWSGGNFRELYNRTETLMYNRFSDIGTRKYVKFKIPSYKHLTNRKVYVVNRIPIIPINGNKFRKPCGFTQNKTPYTKEGRELAGKSELAYNLEYAVRQLGKHYIEQKSVEYNDNRISRFSASKGLCYVSGYDLTCELDNYHCHHIKPISLGGNDSYNNLIPLHKTMHKLVHMTNVTKIEEYINKFRGSIDLKRLNNLREQCGLTPIVRN